MRRRMKSTHRWTHASTHGWACVDSAQRSFHVKTLTCDIHFGSVFSDDPKNLFHFHLLYILFWNFLSYCRNKFRMEFGADIEKMNFIQSINKNDNSRRFLSSPSSFFFSFRSHLIKSCSEYITNIECLQIFEKRISLSQYFQFCAQKSVNACVDAWNRRIGERMRRRMFHHASIRALQNPRKDESNFWQAKKYFNFLQA